MTKEQKIKEAYGDKYELIKDYLRDSDGSLPTFKDLMSEYSTFWFKELGFKIDEVHRIEGDCEPSRWCPLSLANIESNNGWTKIESEEDFPNEGGMYKCISKSGAWQDFHIREIQTEKDTKIYIMDRFTHWKLIVEDLPPIY